MDWDQDHFENGIATIMEYRRTGYVNSICVPGDIHNGVIFVTSSLGLDIFPTRIAYPKKWEIAESLKLGSSKERSGKW